MDTHAHPGWKFYVLIGLILTIVTAVEIAVYYIDALNAWSTAIILPLSASKFLLVVMFYMHLKYDNRLLTAVFAACGALAIAVIVGLVILFKVLPYQPLG
jgi:cytochrome c oxidase subunit 4